MIALLNVSLNRLESSDLVRAMPETEVTYQFKHALVQDTALSSLLNQERKRLHRLVAESLETLYAERLDDIAVRLYQHYDAAGERIKTIEYAERAGEAASRKSAYAEAIIAYTRALTLTELQPDDSERLIRLMTRLGRSYEEDFQYDAALALYHRMRAVAQGNGNRPLELAALVQLAKIYAIAAMRYDPEKSAQISEQALELARMLGDQRAEARVYWAMMLANVYGGQGARQGIKYGQQSLELARALDWREQMAYTLNDLVYVYLNLGEVDRALACATEARALWRELDNKPMLTDNLNAGAMQHVIRGEFEPALALATESRAIAVTIGNRWGESTSYMVEGYAAQVLGNFTTALDAFHAFLVAGDSIGVQGSMVIGCFELARMYAYLGNAERGMFFARDGSERIRNYAIDWGAWGFAVLAYVAERAGDVIAADDAVDKIEDAPPDFYFERMLPFGAVEIIHAQIRRELRRGELLAALARAEQLLERVRGGGLYIFIPRTLDQLARICISQNEFEEAHSALDEGKALAQSLELQPALFALAQTRIELETARNNPAGRESAERESADAIKLLLTTVPPELRASFQTTAAKRFL